MHVCMPPLSSPWLPFHQQECQVMQQQSKTCRTLALTSCMALHRHSNLNFSNPNVLSCVILVTLHTLVHLC